jgi:hypothetical protein
MAFDTMLNSFHNVPKALLQRDVVTRPAEIEAYLRDVGYSRSDAKHFVSAGRAALQRDVDKGGDSMERFAAKLLTMFRKEIKNYGRENIA